MEMPQVGHEFAGYHVRRLIGRGGMSLVFQAENRRLGRVVALKVLAPDFAEDEAFRERFVRESQLAASLDHPNVIPIFDAGDEQGLLYIAMRYVRGDLKSLLQREGQLRPERVASLVAQVASALDAAHDLDLVHRDVKPANILIAARSGSEGRDHVYLADFGLIKHVASRGGLTGTGQFVGTLDYMSPEQIQAKSVDGRTDVYALGCIVYECLTGRVPFDKNTDAAVLWAHLKEDPPRASVHSKDASHGIDEVIVKAMSKSPDDRFQTCMSLVGALRAELQGGAPTRESRRTPGPRATEPRRRIDAGRSAPERAGGSAPERAGRPAGGLEPPPARPVTPEFPSQPGGATRGAGSAGTQEERAAAWAGTQEGPVRRGRRRPTAILIAAGLTLGAIGLYAARYAGNEDRRPDPSEDTSKKVTVAAGGGDALRLVFASDSFGISHIYSCAVSASSSCKLTPDGSRVTLLTNGPVPDEDPVSSADGRIAFVRGRPPAEIFLMNADGTNVRQLTSTTDHNVDPAWSPDGRKIAFARGTPGDIYVMNSQGRKVRRLTDDPADDQDPAWSPDGKKIAFVSHRDGSPAVYVMTSTGGEQTRITFDSATEVRHPSWSPSGRKIAFASDRDGSVEIYVVQADGTGLTQLTDDPASDALGPSWSPDGRKIAFVRILGEERDLSIMGAKGSGRERRLRSGLEVAFDPAWVPIAQ
jgi:hypothetical protein